MADETTPEVAVAAPVPEAVVAPVPEAVVAAPVPEAVAPAALFDRNMLIKAQGDLGTSIAVLGPVYEALQGASRVFDAISNAQAHQAALSRTVDAAKAEVQDLRDQRSNWDEMTQVSMQRAVEAEKEAKDRIEAAATQAALTLTAAHDSLAAELAVANELHVADMQVLMQQFAEAKAAAEATHADMQAKTDAMQADYDALAQKLDSVRSNAAKFAAALQG